MLKDKNDSHLLVLTSDHEISCTEEFLKSVKSGLIYSRQGKLVTFGVVPNGPSTAYGYIESNEPLKGDSYSGSEICSFIEKPCLRPVPIVSRPCRRQKWIRLQIHAGK